MNAPVDIIIDLIKRAKKELEEVRRRELSEGMKADTTFTDGRIYQCIDLIKELEEFKKLFN